MNAEQSTKDALFASAALLALVGLNAKGNEKVFPDEIPEEDTVPAVVYERNDSQPEYTLEGVLVASRVAISVTAWAKTRAEANAIALEVTTAMGLDGHAQTAAAASFEPTLEEYAAVRVFDVWEMN